MSVVGDIRPIGSRIMELMGTAFVCGMGYHYWEDCQHRETDFVLKNGLRIEQLIQVTYAEIRYDIAAREIKALVKAGENSSAMICS